MPQAYNSEKKTGRQDSNPDISQLFKVTLYPVCQ